MGHLAARSATGVPTLGRYPVLLPATSRSQYLLPNPAGPPWSPHHPLWVAMSRRSGVFSPNGPGIVGTAGASGPDRMHTGGAVVSGRLLR